MKRLTTKEQQKYITIKEYATGKVSRKQAAIRIGVRPEAVSRLKTQYEREGKAAFSHKNNGNSHAARTNIALEEKIVALYKDEFSGFNFAHFYEMVRDHNLLGVDQPSLPTGRTVFSILERHNLTSPAANRTKRSSGQHPVRPRRQYFGELVQLDASLHDWLGLGAHRKITLHASIDDATSDVLAAHFEPHETLQGYYRIAKQIYEQYGLPGTFYTDKRTIFEYLPSVAKEQSRIQFQRSCSHLGIAILTTSSPQAKGRIERLFRTMQDRLLNEMRYYHISSIEQANQFLPGYIERHNARFALAEGRTHSIFRALDTTTRERLDTILSVATERSILSGNVVSFKGKQYIPVASNGNVLRLTTDTKVDIVETFSRELLMKHNDEYYPLAWTASGRFTGHTPPASHPWKRWRG